MTTTIKSTDRRTFLKTAVIATAVIVANPLEALAEQGCQFQGEQGRLYTIREQYSNGMVFHETIPEEIMTNTTTDKAEYFVTNPKDDDAISTLDCLYQLTSVDDPANTYAVKYTGTVENQQYNIQNTQVNGRLTNNTLEQAQIDGAFTKEPFLSALEADMNNEIPYFNAKLRENCVKKSLKTLPANYNPLVTQHEKNKAIIVAAQNIIFPQ
jgi:hypothetical protein